MAIHKTHGGDMITAVRQEAALEAQDAASHGYNGRDGDGAQLLKLCAGAVRIAAQKVRSIHAVPEVSADERAEYTSDLVARIIGEHGGRVPANDELTPGYLVKRAAGIILNDHARRTVAYDGHAAGRDGGAPESGADDRLTGTLTLTPEVLKLAEELELSETATRALAAAMIPATRKEWAAFWGYKTPKAFHVTVNRGRRELVAIGEANIRAALRNAQIAS